jgi:hypothetical protein
MTFRDQDLDWLTDTWEWLQPANVALPYIYPTISGEVQAEWSFVCHEIVLKINVKDHRGQWHCMNMDVQSEYDDEERTLNLDQQDEWNWIFQRIIHLQEEQA